MKGRKAIAFALFFGCMAAMTTYLYIAQYRKVLHGNFVRQPVVVAKQNILANTQISPSMVSIEFIPKRYIQPRAIPSVEGVEGFIATANIFSGEQILDTKLAKPNERAMSILIPRDKRAFTIAVNEVTGVAGLVRPGDRIDIIGTFQTTDKATKLVSRAEAVTVLQNLEVLSVGRDYSLESFAPRSGGRSPIQSASFQSQRTRFSNVTLSVTPRQAMDLTLAQQLGVLSLTLRSYYDRPGSADQKLYSKRSTPESVTGIIDPLKIGITPKWLEIRGDTSVVVP